MGSFLAGLRSHNMVFTLGPFLVITSPLLGILSEQSLRTPPVVLSESKQNARHFSIRGDLFFGMGIAWHWVTACSLCSSLE